ncbi:MAG: glycosyltransferase [Bacteroides sp.]|nr:glycosyltransferase [Ruminococcus flavefaciens]MCM1554241.1 glycosyltransferase [Bacteroides sp.]
MIYIALPAMNEPDLPARLLDLNRQSLLPHTVCVCINQPQAYHTDGLPQHLQTCRVNQEVYARLQQMKAEGRFAFRLELIDRFSEPMAWQGKHFGVGWARKTAMDFVAQEAADTDILVCADADTLYPPGYLQDIQKQFDAYPDAVALANPYYHFLAEAEGNGLPQAQQAAILHYEVYMRSYALNMRLTAHPYAFTAVGSSMACRMKAYRKIGGISPFKSGEDFYFLQKLAKTGALIVHSDSVSHPSPRLSERVFFGTGPALQKGMEKGWVSYPIYPMALFGRMKEAYSALTQLFESGRSSQTLDFWEEAFGKDWWKPLKQNCGGKQAQFIHACKEKFDALRSLQFLKANYAQDDIQDWRNLCALCRNLEAVGLHEGSVAEICGNPEVRSLSDLRLQDWKALREYLFLCERSLQRGQPVLPAW